jgi:hypothetical protein
MQITERSTHNLNLSFFGKVDNSPIDLGEYHIDCPKDQYILRMMIKHPDYGFKIPSELKWLEPAIYKCTEIQLANFVDHPFIYVTVRSGVVHSETDDLWHVDGFSMKITHAPEQNYIWVDSYPTEILRQNIQLDSKFDPLKHNIHWYFQDQADDSNVETLKENHIYVIDPYIIHRRPKLKQIQRSFIRISFVPVEIQDDTCMQNPLFPEAKYNTWDIREKLLRFHSTQGV